MVAEVDFLFQFLAGALDPPALMVWRTSAVRLALAGSPGGRRRAHP
jgi:hypothetical protein